MWTGYSDWEASANQETKKKSICGSCDIEAIKHSRFQTVSEEIEIVISVACVLEYLHSNRIC